MKRLTLLIFTFIFVVSCKIGNQIKPNAEMPNAIVWAWERPEDLRFLDSGKFGVAFLAQTLYLENDNVAFRPRHQSLKVSPSIYLIAVTRIETNKDKLKCSTLSDSQKDRIVQFTKNSLERPNVKAVQIDFDVVVSEREFYKNVVTSLRKDLPETIPLTITSLASWCVGDSWFDDFPIDEAVPMAFRMGADSGAVRSFLASGKDWNEPLCRGSYGFSLDEPLEFERKANRRVYYFKSTAWEKSDLDKLER